MDKGEKQKVPRMGLNPDKPGSGIFPLSESFFTQGGMEREKYSGAGYPLKAVTFQNKSRPGSMQKRAAVLTGLFHSYVREANSAW